MSDMFERFDQLNNLVNVEDVFEFIGAKLAKTDGFKNTYECPYHTDETPSLLVDTVSGKFNCFACECGGSGSYSAVKYYLSHQNNRKPSVMMVVNVLADINPQVEQYKYLFATRTVRPYDYGRDKKKEFRSRIKTNPVEVGVMVQRKYMNAEQLAVYIDSIMTGMPEELVVRALGVVGSDKQQEVSDEFKSLLGED